MNESEELEIINYINSKYQENVPGVVRRLIKGKIKKIEKFSSSELPPSLRNCTVEELLNIVQKGIREGQVKF